MTERTRHGLIIGKFCPPHAGHHVLIRGAAAASERVTVLVLARSDDPVPLERRIAWLTEVHAADANVTVAGAVDDHPDDFADPAVWDVHMAVIDAGISSVTTEPVTAVFSSETYGHELARRMRATNVVVDVERTLEPISATEIRADLVANWEHLAEPTRGGLSTPVVVIGAESTGKTTLSRALADALRARGGAHGLTRWVPEHGRPFTIDKLGAARAVAGVAGLPLPTMTELVWTTDEFEDIARTQNHLEDAASRIGGPALICDTDSFATAIWHERYLGAPSPAVEALTRHHPLYLLTHHDDVPFAQDGIRDGEAIRSWMTNRFVEALAASGRRTVVLRGSHEERVDTGRAAIDAVVSTSLRERRWSTR